MALDFPTPTTVGQVFTQGSLTYTWDGTKWKSATGAQSDVDALSLTTPQTIDSDKAIATNKNAGMMGPIVALNSGVIVTINANSILTLLR